MIKISIAFVSFMWAFLFGFGLATPPMSANELVSHAPDNAQVYIISPTEGDTLSETFKVEFGLTGMGIAPAGILISPLVAPIPLLGLASFFF